MENNTKFTFPILQLITTFQTQNGIRNKDYERYIQFLGKKINKLRKTFKLTQGKKKFTKIEINSNNLDNQKILLIPLLEIERLWAWGSLYNHKLTSKDSVVSKWRYSAKEKFYRSSIYCEKLINLVKEKCDEISIQEIEAYYYTIIANYQMFTRKFSQALENFQNAKETYTKIIQKKDSIEGIIYKERIIYLTMQIRYCNYNLTSTENKTNHIFDIEEEVKIDEDINIINNTETLKTIDNYEIKYQNNIIPIKNLNLRQKLVKIDEIVDKINKEEELTKKQNFFSDIFNLIDDSIKIIKLEKTEKCNDGENINQILNKLLNYSQYYKINNQIWKTNLYIIDYKSYFYNKFTIVDILEKDNVKLNVKPQEMIKLYDNLIQYYSQIRVNEREFNDEIFLNILNLKEKISNSCKIFYCGYFYLSNKKLTETLSIFNNLKDKYFEIVKIYEMNKNLKCKELDEMIDELESLIRNSEFISHKIFSKLKLDNLNKVRNGEKEEKREKITYKCNSWLQSDMNGDKESINNENYKVFSEFMKMNFEEFKDSLKKQNYNNFTHLIQFPPSFLLLPPKPISFDLVYSSIKYPEIKSQSKENKTEKQSLIGRAFGYMFGKK